MVKNPPANAGDKGDTGSVPGSGRSPGGGIPLFHYSCLENPMNRGAWRATVHGVAKSHTWLSTHTDKMFIVEPRRYCKTNCLKCLQSFVIKCWGNIYIYQAPYQMQGI